MSKDAIREDVGYHDVRLIKGETISNNKYSYVIYIP